MVATNLNVTIADIYYKTGDAYEQRPLGMRNPRLPQDLTLPPTRISTTCWAFMRRRKRVPDATRPGAYNSVNDLLTMKPDAHQDEPAGHAECQPDCTY